MTLTDGNKCPVERYEVVMKWTLRLKQNLQHTVAHVWISVELSTQRILNED